MSYYKYDLKVYSALLKYSGQIYNLSDYLSLEPEQREDLNKATREAYPDYFK